MADPLQFFVGNRDPSISETITSGGVAIDLTGKTVKFKARAVGSSTLLVDAAAVIVSAPAGTVRYDWTAGDIAASGILGAARTALVWWEVTSAGKTQDMNEASILVLAHAPGLNAYVELEEVKRTGSLTGTSFLDDDLRRDIVTASRIVDYLTGRRFWLDVDDTQIRYYTPRLSDRLWIDDLVDLTSFQTDPDGDGTFDETWTLNTDFTLEPLNAVADARPWDLVRVHPSGSFRLPGYPRSVKVTGQFGWAAVPSGVKSATIIIATRVMKRARDAPFGVAALGPDGEAIRIARTDPDVQAALGPFMRAAVLA